jgi:hypothetical protein
VSRLPMLAVGWLVAAAGCAGPVPVSVISTRDIDRAPDDPSAETQEILDDAFGVWGLAWTPSATIDGALELTLTGFDEAAEVHGFNARSGRCDKSITVEPDALLLAHEIGHVFGIEAHEDDAGQVMSHPDVDWEVTEVQMEIVAEDAERFSRCW